MSIPRVETRNGQKILLVDDKPFILLSGELHNSSSSTLEYMAPIWDKMQALHLNSLLFPVTWQQVEPREGEFHFELVDGLIEQAKAHGMKFGILWFGTWKNAACSYAPTWVKKDLERFPRAEVEKGLHYKNIPFMNFTMPYTTLSAFSKETARMDARAFAKLCAHLREYDTDHTVVLIQVENETGILGAGRDHCDLADEAFAAQVPAELVEGLLARRDGLVSDVREALERCQEGTWEEVFGEAAEEVFMAWYTAKHIETVAAAGKAEYPLPMYTNCWLVQGGKPGEYPSGGPVYRVMEVYQIAAPSLSWVAPDIYIPEFLDTCKKYTKQGNPLFIPEIALQFRATSRLLYAVGRYHALCFAPFGIEDIGKPADTSLGEMVGMDTGDLALKNPLDPCVYGRMNELLQGMMPVLTSLYGTSDLQAVMEEELGEEPNDSMMKFGDFAVCASYEVPGIPGLNTGAGALLAARTGPDEVYLLGYCVQPYFVSLDSEKPFTEYLSIEEGEFIDGEWVMHRLLNGDEEYIHFGAPGLLRIRIHRYL